MTCLLSLLTLVILSFAISCHAGDEYENAPIHYSATAPNDLTAQLQKQMDVGTLQLPRGDAWKLMSELQKRYGVLPSSQTMVFSKTSKQNDLIHPATPRVIYFGDNAYLGYSVGGSIEVAAIDPKLGPVFYLIDPEPRRNRPLRFERDQGCLSCHGGPFSPDVPGVLVRSVIPGTEGHPLMSQGSKVVDTTTPFGERWGGWYVTGKHGKLTHRGNTTAKEEGEVVSFDASGGQNIADLSRFFDTSPYPIKTSDIVALMVLEHQTSTQNILTKAHHTAMRAMHMQTSLQRELGETVRQEPCGTAERMITLATEDVLDAILFKEEAVLPDGGIEGTQAFVDEFSASAPLSKEGRSLKDFQLLGRLFKYRCSYMVYSVTFQHLIPQLKTPVMKQLKAVMTAHQTPERYAHLSDSERKSIHKILTDTLADY
jgi:hypothetical protein